ncbi:MAG: hypothetical protein QOD75_1883 [Blastocatellia bacterium]|jgi:anti-sigma factor RsiW|nr:hypothetical protein [Blastocatellia bacterium]
MSDSNEKPVCSRANDLVDYLYGETSAADAADFARHMGGCSACRTEFALMTNVRESMSQWRSEVLGLAWRAEPVAFGGATESLPAKRLSALAALREFFTVSPLWLRGATAFAVGLFCMMVALFVARTWTPRETLYTKAEVNAQVQRELARVSNEPRSDRAVTVNSPSKEAIAQKEPGSQILPASSTATTHPRAGAPRITRHLMSRAEREQLASDLRLRPTADEEDLTFLLEGGSN